MIPAGGRSGFTPMAEALTGVGFKLSTIITGAAQAAAGGVGSFIPAALVDPKSLPEAVQRQRVRAWTAIKSGH